MPSSFSSLDTGFPNLNKYGSTEQKLQAIESYLVQLLEQLRYTLNNLSQDNFNTKEVTGWLGQVVTEPIQVAIQDAEEQIYTQIDVTAEGVKSTVAQATHQYDESGVSGGINYYGYGDPTLPAAGNSGKKYLDQNSGYYWTCNGSTWTKNSTALPLITDKKQDSATLITTINQSASKIQTSAIKYDNNDGHLLSSWMTQTAEDISARVTDEDMQSAIEASADDIMLTVTGAAAPEWEASHSYAKDDVVKVTTAATASTAQSITYYKAKSNHTSSAGNKPPNATYWASTSAPNVQSMIDLNLNGLTLSYDNGNIGNNEHNGSYIKLMKDGTFIGGGKVFIKDLDASTITTGTLDAGNIILQEAFTVKAKDSGDTIQDCGHIGGYARTGGNNTIVLSSANDLQTVEVENDGIFLWSENSGKTKRGIISAEPDYIDLECRDSIDNCSISAIPSSIDLECYDDDDNGCMLRITSSKIRVRKKTSGTWGSWTDLIS